MAVLIGHRAYLGQKLALKHLESPPITWMGTLGLLVGLGRFARRDTSDYSGDRQVRASKATFTIRLFVEPSIDDPDTLGSSQMHEIDMWRAGWVVIAGKGLRQKLEWLIRVDESQPKYTNLNDGSEGDASDLIMKINREKLGGYEDWRLPDKIELYALTDDPHEPKESIRFWSSSPTRSTEVAWHYYFCSFNGGAPETEPRSTPLPVRLVRSVQNGRDPVADAEEASRWCDSEPGLEGSNGMGVVELIERISAPMLKQHPEVQVRVRRYADDGAAEIFATLGGSKTSCWSENFTHKHSTIAEDFMAMNRAFPERSSIGGGGGWIDRFPLLVDSLVMTVASLLWEIGVHVCDEGDEVFTAFCDGVSREVRLSLPNCSNIRVGSRTFTYAAR